ncbi:MAG: hypothetical protein ACRYG8_21080 [Janthinobacterium lividum]
MKALKSDLAKRVLADPKASSQLRRFLANTMLSPQVASERSPSRVAERPGFPDVIEIRNDQGRTVRFKPVFVPKAGDN